MTPGADKTSQAVDRIFQEENNFILLGLTGRTGSGCSTAASILCNEENNWPQESCHYQSQNDKRKYRIVKDYISRRWVPFKCIQVSHIISDFLFKLPQEDFICFICSTLSTLRTDHSQKIDAFLEDFNACHNETTTLKNMPENNDEEITEKANKSIGYHFTTLPLYSEKLKNFLETTFGIGSFVKIFQTAGDNLRASGEANCNIFDPKSIFAMPTLINKIVKAIRRINKTEKQPTHIVIDAIRNPYEALFFKQRYSNFYLISINTPNSERISHLRDSHKYTNHQINELDEKEYPKRSLSGSNIFTSQNIQKCIEISDIHINNPSRDPHDQNEMKCQLAWYYSLILHPGLITPTSLERGMQLAFSAKLNSGCISRQVGAVVTDENFSIRSVGWNSTPEGHVPCILRSAVDLDSRNDKAAYSAYELKDSNFINVFNNSFSHYLRDTKLNGINFSYCFKDLQNEVDGEKNQVHTRSLHAEENAFLQISKYGGTPLKNGILFTTASPCELCSKKAFQIGISKIIYVDPYPGIANEHILECGNNKPTLILFSGAVGKAYHQLYQPFFAHKDELKMILGYSINGGKGQKNRESKEQEIEGLKQQIADLQNQLASRVAHDDMSDS